MALQKQVIPISFGQGIDTKTDKKQQLVGKLRRAKNVVFETLLSAKKRFGYDSILLYDTSGTKVTDAIAISKYKDELVVFNPDSLYSFSESLQALQEKGTLYNVFPFNTPVLNNSYNHDSLDVTSVEGLNVHAYHNTIIDDVRYSVQDSATKSLIVSDDVVATAAQSVQVSNIQNTIYIVYAQGANLRYRSFNILNPSSLSSAVTLATDVDTTAPKLDIVSGPDKLIIAYNSTNVGTELRVLSVLSNGVATSVIGVTGAKASHALDCYMDSSSRIVVSYSNGAAIGYAIFPYNLVAALLGATNVETIAGVSTISTIETSSGYKIYYQVAATLSVNDYVKSAATTLAGVVSLPVVFLRSVGLASKVFSHSDATYVPVTHSTTLQNTYFVVDSATNVVAKWSAGSGGGRILKGVLPQTIELDSENFLITTQMKSKLASENGTFFGLLGVNSTNVSFDYSNKYQNSFLGDNLHISGGVLQMYDGDTVTEHGFHVYPEELVAGTQSTSNAGSVAAGNYGYKALYRWTDNAGQDHFSAPSLNLDVDFVSSAAPSGTLATTAPIVVTSAISGTYANTNTLTVVIAAAAANPTNTVLAVVSGTWAAATLTITPNNGTNNTLVPVTLTTAELAELILNGSVVGKTVTVTDALHILQDLNATGGSAANVVTGSYAVTLSGGVGLSPAGSLATTAPILLYSRTPGPTKNGTKLTLQIAPAAANPTDTVLAVFTGTESETVLTITPNDGTNNGAVPVSISTAQVAELISYGSVTGKNVTLTDASSLRADYRATGGGATLVADGGQGDGLAASLVGGLLLTAYVLTVPTLRLTNKSNVVIELYRTEDDGDTYYLVSSVSSPTFNTKTNDTVTFTDTLADADIISRQVLYTTGGELENIAAPASSLMTVHTASNRVVVGIENSANIQYSKIRQAGRPVEFNDDLLKTLDPTAGNITALSNMDDKLIIFRETGIQYFSGQGPNNLGEQDLFTDPEAVSGDVGCNTPNSIVYTPVGLFFKSKKGIYLLGRDLSIMYKGAPVEAYNQLNITSAKVIPDHNQVRFTTSDGDTLVYNYQLDLWCTFDNHRALSAEVVANQYYYLRTSHELFKENSSVYGDNGVPIKLLLETGWMNMMSLQGYQRVYQMLVLGDYKSEHTLKIQASFNFNEAFVQEKLVTPSSTFIDAVPYGGYSPYGEPVDIPYGGSGNVYQARFDFKTQKCQSLKLQIEDVQSAAGEGLSLSAVTLLVGGKGGLFKLDNNRKFGLE